MDKIRIKDLEVFYRVGVPEEERRQPQRLLISVDLAHDFVEAAATDDLSQTIDYGAICRQLADFGAGRSWKLIETLAVAIADHLLREFKPEAVEVTVKKFVIPSARYVSVTVRRNSGRI